MWRPRKIHATFSFYWKFAKGVQPKGEKPAFDDATWENINLPHDWAISGPFGKLTAPGNTGNFLGKGKVGVVKPLN